MTRCSAARTEATIESLGEVLAGEDVGPVADQPRDGDDTADAAGRPLFAGLARQPWPEDPYGRLWRACDLLREHRGDGHIAASIAAGLDPVAMNVLTELWVGMPFGTYSATRGWSADQLATAAARGCGPTGCSTATSSRIVAASGATGWRRPPTRWRRGIVDALGPGFDDVVAQLDEWSRRCIAAGGVPARRLQARRRLTGAGSGAAGTIVAAAAQQ